MTAHRDLKNLIRACQHKTGESYVTAHTHVMRARAELLGRADDIQAATPALVEAAVLKVNQQSARVRPLGSSEQITFRSTDACSLIPGLIVRLHIERRWTYRGDTYATGRVEGSRLDVAGLGLQPLPLTDEGLYDLTASYEPFRDPDPYAPLWRRLAAAPRRCFQMHPIAWGAQGPGSDKDVYLVCKAAELTDVGDVEGARELLMKAVCKAPDSASWTCSGGRNGKTVQMEPMNCHDPRIHQSPGRIPGVHPWLYGQVRLRAIL